MSLFSVILLFSITLSKASITNETNALLYETLASLKSALEFLFSEHENVNLDAVIGTRIVEGQFRVLIDRIESHPDNWLADSTLLRNIKELKELAGKVSRASIPFIATNSPKYYQKIGTILNEGFWELDYQSRDFSPNVQVWPYKDGESLQEIQSDNCLAEFFGTGKQSDIPCDVSTKCWDIMTKPFYNGYSLTHQLFYLQIGEQDGCRSEMELKRYVFKQPSLDKLKETFCANIFNEAALIAQSGFPESKQDLFMEQAALCGMVGFRQFFSYDWLREVLSWQNKDLGCYIGKPILESDVHLRRNAEGMIKRTMRQRRPSLLPRPQHLRYKREERILREGCLSHRTTVAVSALGQYVRYIMEYMVLQARSSHS